MKIRTLIAAVLTTATLSLLTTTLADAADATMKARTGTGLAACPKETFCLYENENYNEDGPAHIWVFTNSATLKNTQAADKGRSAYQNNSKHYVFLQDYWTYEESTYLIQMSPGAKLPSLDNVTAEKGGLKRTYEWHTHSGSGGAYQHFTSGTTVSLNDKAGSIRFLWINDRPDSGLLDTVASIKPDLKATPR